MITIRVLTHRLSDGGEVFGVRLYVDGDATNLILDAYDKKHADALAVELEASIRRHTPEQVCIY